MPTNPSRCRIACLFVVVVNSWLDSSLAARMQDELSRREPARRSAAATSVKTVGRQGWPLIHIPDPVARRATIAALESVSARFVDAHCRKVLSDFEDPNGQPLADRLSSVAADIHVYLTMVTFIDDTQNRRCASGALAFTAPGSRVVRVCVGELKRLYADQPDYVVASLMHEILHTLGLGENPPASREITGRVLARCGQKQAGGGSRLRGFGGARVP